MFRKIKNIFGYIWPILHDFFIAKETEKLKKEKISLSWKVFPVQWRRIFEKYQNQNGVVMKKKSVFLPIK